MKLCPIAAYLALICWSPALGAEPQACADGETFFKAKAYDRAQSALWNCVIAGAESSESAHKLTLTYRELKNYKAGLERATAVLAATPASEDVLYVAGFLQFRLLNHHES